MASRYGIANVRPGSSARKSRDATLYSVLLAVLVEYGGPVPLDAVERRFVATKDRCDCRGAR